MMLQVKNLSQFIRLYPYCRGCRPTPFIVNVHKQYVNVCSMYVLTQ